MYWRGKHKFSHLEVAPGGSFAGFGGPSLGNKTYYVDTYHTYASDSNQGLDVTLPFKSIQAALDVCVADQNDYVYVIDAYQADATAIIPTKQMFHLIGIQNPNCPWMNLNAQSDTEDIMGGTGGGLNYSEIAGLGFGGGATAKGGIYLSQTIGLWVHHCTFGHSFGGDTPDFGIHGGAQNHEACLFEDNIFLGSGNNCQGTIAVDGIRLLGATASKNVVIRRNVFMGIPGVAISVNCFGGMILNNTFSMDADTAGSAITLSSVSKGCWIDGNSANFGDTDAATGPPWLDSASGGADTNNWGRNWEGSTEGYPA